MSIITANTRKIMRVTKVFIILCQLVMLSTNKQLREFTKFLGVYNTKKKIILNRKGNS